MSNIKINIFFSILIAISLLSANRIKASPLFVNQPQADSTEVALHPGNTVHPGNTTTDMRLTKQSINEMQDPFTISFTDISETCGVHYKDFDYRPWDVSIGDINNDGINDVYCMAHTQGRNEKRSIMYLSNSTLVLTDVTDTVFSAVTATGGGQGSFFVDLNADGWLDLVTGSNDWVGCAFENQQDGSMDWYRGFPGYEGALGARELAQGDMDRDGDLDVIIAFHHQNLRIATNDGTGTYNVDFVSWIDGESTCGATLPVVADMDGDGDPDIVSQYMSAYGECPVSRTVTVDFWQNNGSGTFTWVSDTHGLVDGKEGCITQVADFDNDGDLDIIQLARGGSGSSRYYVNDGYGYFTEESASRGIAGATVYTDWWSKGITGDFDNDGDLDIVYDEKIWVNDGAGNFTEESLGVSYGGRISSAGDLDNDGDLDLAGVRSHWEPQYAGFWVYRNNTNNNAWLKVRVNAGPRNPFGVGSKVSIFNGSELLGYRQVINSSAMQQPMEQHFGLGTNRTVRLEVKFPDGSQKIINNVASGQTITIVADAEPYPKRPDLFRLAQ